MREHLTTVAPAKPALSDAAGGVEGPVLSDTAGGVEGARAQADSPPRRRLRPPAPPHRRLAPALAASLLLALSACAATSATAPATYTNPIIHADYSDPDVIRVGEDYFMIASSFHFSPGIPVLRSRDLVHWTIIGHVLPRLPFAPEYDMVPPFTLTDATQRPVGPGLRYAAGVWAPAIRHHNGRFHVYWATPTEGIFMSSAERAEGPWTAPVTLVAEAGLEDPAPFWDEDGSAWLIHSRVGAGPLILRRMSPDGTRVLDEGRVVAEDPVNLPILEGPKLHRRDGYYYIFAPIGGVETGPQAVGRARDIQGPYEWRVVLEQGSTPVQAPHQGGYVETPSGQGWFVHFNSTGAFGRITYLQPVRWQDGWPVMGDPIPGRVSGQPVMTHPMPDTGYPPDPSARIQDSDEFDAATLGHQWEWNHNPVAAGWSLTERPGWLRLRALPAEHLVTARNTLTQILQGPRMRATARIDASRMADGQRAGITMLQTRPSWLGLVREQGATRIAFAVEGAETLGPVIPAGAIRLDSARLGAAASRRPAMVDLRVEVTPDQQAHFSYSLDGGRNFTGMGGPVALRFSWWKGARPALFTFHKSADYAAPPSGWIDVDWWRVETADELP
ncbi:glycoside hydrolase family 43 protein [Sphingosinicella terrae]|uniref:glycoside hydrolase family 43 protein n=1 Tax=Sphingosinicella terrae TaxID=2172047 RepID=UPI000E0D9F77|nr:glycoside hydrolase 43 family protein [Sphingosinicella terrae]